MKALFTIFFILLSFNLPALSREFPDASTIQAWAEEEYSETLKRTAEALKVKVLDQMSDNRTSIEICLVDTVEEDAFRTIVGPELEKAHWHWKIKYDVYWGSQVAFITTKP